MGATSKIRLEKNYIHVVSDGDKTFDYVIQLWHDIVAACREHECFKVFGVSTTSTTLKTWDAYRMSEIFDDLQIDAGFKIAWVETNPEAYQSIYFIETVLFNRGYSARVFLDEDDALRWLLEDD